eukprot:1249583-Rhodomonas_salina.1
MLLNSKAKKQQSRREDVLSMRCTAATQSTRNQQRITPQPQPANTQKKKERKKERKRKNLHRKPDLNKTSVPPTSAELRVKLALGLCFDALHTPTLPVTRPPLRSVSSSSSLQIGPAVLHTCSMSSSERKHSEHAPRRNHTQNKARGKNAFLGQRVLRTRFLGIDFGMQCVQSPQTRPPASTMREPSMGKGGEYVELADLGDRVCGALQQQVAPDLQAPLAAPQTPTSV